MRFLYVINLICLITDVSYARRSLFSQVIHHKFNSFYYPRLSDRFKHVFIAFSATSLDVLLDVANVTKVFLFGIYWLAEGS